MLRARLALPVALPVAMTLCSATPAASQSVWTQVQPPQTPSPRWEHAMTFDAVRGVVVLFGGYSPGSSTFLDDTWTFDGTTWTQRAPAAHPSARGRAAMCFDSAAQRILLIAGGSFNWDTWSWDGTNWTQLQIFALQPGSYSAAFDPLRNVVVAFNGQRTYEWNGAGDWSQRIPAHSPAGNYGAMAFDSAAGVTVLFADGLTWLWNGADWTQATPSSSPSSRSLHAMTFDVAAGKIVLFGGYSGTEQSDTWVWNGSTWTQQLAANPPPARHSHALAYDAVRQRVVLFGGFPGLGDTWIKNPVFGSPATAVPFGAGCAGAAGVPQLVAAGGTLPWIGSTLVMELRSLPPLIFRAPFGILGASNTTWGGVALPQGLDAVGMPGCNALVGIDQIDPLVNLGGTARWLLSVPNTAALVGAHGYLQGLVVDPPVNAFGAVVSNGVDCTIGSR